MSPRRNAHAPPAPRTEPTSWNGISYDDMMRSLEDALTPTDERPTIVDPQSAVPTRPADFEPFTVTQRMHGRARADAEVAREHTELMHVQQHHSPAHAAPTTVAPVALCYVDLDDDVDLELDPTLHRTFASKASSRKRITTKGIFVGAALAIVIAVGSYAHVNPDARTSASATAAPPPPPPAVAPVAPVAAVAEPVQTTPVMTDAPAVPTMRAPTAPPVVRQTKAKRVNADEAKPAEVDAADPSSLLDRGLGN